MSSADLLAENVEKSISHIVQTYGDVMTVAKELLMENLDHDIQLNRKLA